MADPYPGSSVLAGVVANLAPLAARVNQTDVAGNLAAITGAGVLSAKVKIADIIIVDGPPVATISTTVTGSVLSVNSSTHTQSFTFTIPAHPSAGEWLAATWIWSGASLSTAMVISLSATGHTATAPGTSGAVAATSQQVADLVAAEGTTIQVDFIGAYPPILSSFQLILTR